MNRLFFSLLMFTAFGIISPVISMKRTLEEDVSLEGNLIDAAKEGNLAEVKKLLDRGVNVNALVDVLDDAYKETTTALIQATKNGHLAVVQELLNRGADVNAKDREDNTALEIASEHGYLEIVKELFKAGAKKGGLYPLMLAAENGHLDVVKELLDQGAVIHENTLTGAIANGHLSVARELIKRGAEVNITNDVGDMPLILALKNGHRELVDELLARGGGIDARLYDGSTPLMLAVDVADLDIVKQVLDLGANINLRNQRGETALISAVLPDIRTRDLANQLNIIKELLSRLSIRAQKDLINTPAKHGVTPLMYAAQNGYLEVVKEFLDRGADIDARDKNGDTALFYAVRNRRLDIVKELLNRGAYINASNFSGATALTVAADFGTVEVVKELLINNARISTELYQRIIDPQFLRGHPHKVYLRQAIVRLIQSLYQLKQAIIDKTITPSQALNMTVERGNSFVVRYLLNTYKFNIDGLSNLLGIAKTNYLKAENEELKNNYKEIGRLLIAQIGISAFLSQRGVLAGEGLRQLPPEIVEHISSRVDIRDVK